ncbi:MAG: DUF59 domain-containing protein [Acidimicrobiaceae bacterium]|nr:DUF59 domain-containing protein [Acidimicrobiaceae bacterium]MYE65778.1 DUF59 domain-containing protein [Acidimicrobiaceae bacterium]
MASIQIRRRLRPECQADMAIAATSSGHHHHTKWAMRYWVSMKRWAKSAARSVASATHPDGCSLRSNDAPDFVSDAASTDMVRDTSGWILAARSAECERAEAGNRRVGTVTGEARTALVIDVIDALRGVDDPEYPGVSVVDMGMIASTEVADGQATVELITTFSGCPAHDVITADIATAVGALDGITGVEVRRSTEHWDTSRLSDHARAVMAQDFTVSVALPGKPTECPRCGAAALVEQSPFGPARCRAVHRCRACGEVVEVLRA